MYFSTDVAIKFQWHADITKICSVNWGHLIAPYKYYYNLPIVFQRGFWDITQNVGGYSVNSTCFNLTLIFTKDKLKYILELGIYFWCIQSRVYQICSIFSRYGLCIRWSNFPIYSIFYNSWNTELIHFLQWAIILTRLRYPSIVVRLGISNYIQANSPYNYTPII